MCFDWEDDARAERIVERVLAEAPPGAIVCLHDGDRKGSGRSAASAPTVRTTLLRKRKQESPHGQRLAEHVAQSSELLG